MLKKEDRIFTNHYIRIYRMRYCFTFVSIFFLSACGPVQDIKETWHDVKVSRDIKRGYDPTPDEYSRIARRGLEVCLDNCSSYIEC